MKKETIISIINNDIKYQSSLNLLLKSAAYNSNKLLENDWYILYAEGTDIKIDFKKYNPNLHLLEVSVKETDDVYALKFAIINFIEMYGDSNHILTYLDTDHIVLQELVLPQVDCDTIFFSSEKNTTFIEKLGLVTDYNSSFIRADIPTWKKVIYGWRKWYEKLAVKDVGRFREEVAMSCAVQEAGITIKMVPPKIQSNFQSFDKNCALFHYGGEYPIAKSLKKLFY